MMSNLNLALVRQVASELAAVLDHVGPVLDLAAELEIKERRIAPFMASGFSLAPSIPEKLELRIQQLPKYTSSSVGSILIQHYSGDDWSSLEAVVTGWETNSFLEPRVPLVRDALWALRSQRYRLVVAALLPQIEGIIWDWLFAFTSVEERRRLINKEKNIRRKTRPGRSDDTAWVGSLAVYTIGQVQAKALDRDQWTRMKTFAHFAKNRLYQYIPLYKDYAKHLTSRRLSRHAFAHGSGLGSGTRINALRLFLALDVLAMMKPSDEGGSP